LFTASFRADGSSKFSPENHWAYFPSGAIAWRFTSENFMKNQHILTDGKLRVSYGNTGNNRVSDFAYLATYSQTPALTSVYTFNNVPITGAVPATIGNPDLKWETTSQLNAGVDVSLLGDRVSLTADIYRKKTKNLLLNASVPTSSGYSTVYMNVGSVQNQGLELSLNVTPVKKKDLTWSSSINISFNQSKVLGLAQGQQTLQSMIRWDNAWATAPAYIAQVGKALGLMYGYVWEGVYQYDDFNKNTAGGYTLKDDVTTNGNARASVQPGDIKYKDINGDKVVNQLDYTIIGRGLPVHIGGFNNNVTYKGFDLNVFLQWSYGNEIQNANNMVFSGNALNKTYLNQFASYNNRWTPTNTNTDQFRTNGFYGGGYSSRTVEDGSFVRLKTLALGYTFPRTLLKKAKINSFRLYASAQNLLTLTHYSGQDPEVNAYNSVLTAGFDYSPYPRARTIVFGANISF
jgi:TonB-linked SusC/RagA family outer membrane protein